eukprot:214321_1
MILQKLIFILCSFIVYIYGREVPHWMDDQPNESLSDSDLLKKAQHARNGGKHETARVIRDILLSRDANNPYWHSLAAALYEDDEKYELAASERKRTADLMVAFGYPIHRAEEQASYAVELINLGRLEEAQTAIEKSFGIIADNGHAWKATAFLYWREGGHDENSIIELFEKAISKAPERSLSHFKASLGFYYYHIQKWNIALDTYENISLDKEYVDYKAYYMVGRISRELKLWDHCNKFLLYSLRDRPKYEDSNLEYLLYLIDTHQFDKFDQHLLTLNDEEMNIKWKWNTVIAYYNSVKNQFDTATDIFQNKVLPELPEQFYYFSKFHKDRVYFYLSKHLMSIGNYTDAIRYLQMIVNELRPTWAEAHLFYAQSLLQIFELKIDTDIDTFNLGIKHLELAYELNKAVPWDKDRTMDFYDELKNKIASIEIPKYEL